MPLNLRQIKQHAKEYVELEARTKVTGVKFVRRFELFGREDVLLLVKTIDKESPEWWVIGGATPMNLYSTKDFPHPDETYSMHQGLMLRVADRQFREDTTPPRRIGYDAFISHASEDKERVVKPLARQLTALGYDVWYDEFALKVGDSLRQSIDQGLASSRYGIVVLSPSFFAKNWPQYELNGLAAREIDGKKVVLPIWHEVSKADVMKYSPTLADKVALSTKKLSVKKLAAELSDVFETED